LAQSTRQVKEQHQHIMDIITPYLVRVHHMSKASSVIKQFSQQLETCVYEQYMASLSYLNIYRVRKELKLMKSIQFRIKKENYILRATDKSGIFHLGNAKDYQEKSEIYRQKLVLILNWKVIHYGQYLIELCLLNDLHLKNQIQV
jgi:hypothetical protein